MYRLTRPIIFVTLLALLSIPVTSLAEPSDEEASAGSMERLAVAVETLVKHLEAHATEKNEDMELRKLDIAISYLNFRSRRIELMERDLTMIRNDRSRYEDTIRMWQERLDLLLTEMEEKTADEREELERSQAELEMRVKGFEQRLTKLDEEIIIQENKITDLQNDLDAVESYIQQHLQL